ncbi:HNH endonuclease signature motif containing protein [Gelidibacter japonicus]|uniref:HNH endonuclease signature motif containing protein n=1 Tax=Gelidibacter japonicus TaxID=1962232 RepID=UPI002AFEFFFD|nr:HNH endonuclease signature motif containing protein [Gelidibacter japonicus]
MKNIQNILTTLAILIAFTFSNAQTTYTVGSTEYTYGEYYSTTGKPKVVRSASNKSAFLKSKGYKSTPYGYEVDHIIPLSQGGTDDPSNMQLLTISQHRTKTARERSQTSKSNSYNGYTVKSPTYYSTPKVKTVKHNYSTPSYSVPKNRVPTYKSSSNYSTPPVKSTTYKYSTPSYSAPKYRVPTYKSSNYNSSSSSIKTIHTGPRGGKYYMNSKGNKTYIKR